MQSIAHWVHIDEDEASDDEPAKRAKLDDAGRDHPAANGGNGEEDTKRDEGREQEEDEYGEDLDGEEEGDMDPESALQWDFWDAMKNVVHEPQHGSYLPPAKVSSGCPYAAHNHAAMPVPPSGVVAGTLRLADVPGSRLDYAVALEVGTMLEGELYDGRTVNGFVRFAHVMDMYETVVPPAHRGQGHAKRLVRAAFAVAHAYGYSVRPSCTYISQTFLAARPAEEYDVWYGRRCEELLLFNCCPEGRALDGRRRELARLPVDSLKARCEQAGEKIGGAKYLMVERLLGREFGPAAERRTATLAGEEMCRERRGLGCGGCRVCRGEGSDGWVDIGDAEMEEMRANEPDRPFRWVRRRRADEPLNPVPPAPHERCILFNGGPESAEWGPPTYMALPHPPAPNPLQRRPH